MSLVQTHSVQCRDEKAAENFVEEKEVNATQKRPGAFEHCRGIPINSPEFEEAELAALDFL
jgi:hypothetical protein